MANHMNVFEPYASKAAHHEDALTRAFLLVLRGVPVAHSAWLSMVDCAHRAAGGKGVPSLHELGAPTIRTQTSQVDEEVKRVISLVQTDEVYFKDGDAAVSERRQVLDGVVTYDQELAIVVENKPRCENIWAGQLDVNVPEGVTLDKTNACVTWKDIVLAWGGLLDAGHLGRAETVLLGDFLDYVEEHFSHLRPYSKVALCGQDEGRLKRRCQMLLQAIAGERHVQHHRGWSWYILLADVQSARQIGLKPMRGIDGLDLVVEIDPGDTMAQAKKLYGECELSEVLALQDHGWAVKPNLHVAHMTLNLLWTHTTISIDDYWRFWLKHTEWHRQIRRDKFEETFASFVANGLGTEADRIPYESKVILTNRQSFNLCPGLTMRWRKRLDDAAVLDQRGRLEGEVRAAIERASKALKLSLPWQAPS
jgi:hypothetical protein